MSRFFAYLARMKHIKRWGLMRNVETENIQEHSHACAVLAHGLAVLKNTRFGGCVDVGRVVQLALFHEAAEVITGDLPTPIKYYNSDIKAAYKAIEGQATQRLLDMLPADMREVYVPLLYPPEDEVSMLVKAADKLCAYIKCLEELKAGNQEFAEAKATTEQALHDMHMPEVEAFMEAFLPGFSLSLDGLNR